MGLLTIRRILSESEYSTLLITISTGNISSEEPNDSASEEGRTLSSEEKEEKEEEVA